MNSTVVHFGLPQIWENFGREFNFSALDTNRRHTSYPSTDSSTCGQKSRYLLAHVTSDYIPVDLWWDP